MRPDRGPTRCADMTTPFGGMGVAWWQADILDWGVDGDGCKT